MSTSKLPLPSSKLLLSLLFVSLGLRLLSLGFYPLMDTTEARYGEMARIMFETGNWVTPMFDYGVPFWGKPPIFTWLSSLGFSAFGINEFAARVPHLLVGCGVIWLVYGLAKSHYNDRNMGLFAAAILATTLSFLLISGAVMTDTALTFSITLSMISFWQAWQQKGRAWGYLFFLGLTLGMLSKGPLAVVLVGISLTIWLIPNKRWKKLPTALPWVRGSLLFILLTAPWYVLAELRTPGFLDYFIVGEHIKRFVMSGWQGDLYGSAHEEIRGTIWLYAFAAMLPWSPVLIWQWLRSLKDGRDSQESSDGFTSYIVLWLLAPLLLFTFAGNILASYVMPALPAMALLVVHFHSQKTLPNGLYKLGFVSPVLISLVVVALHFNLTNKQTEKALLGIWQQQSEAADAELFFLQKRPFSGQFYSSGKAKLRSSEVDSWLPQQAKPFFIIEKITNTLDYPNWSCQDRGEVRQQRLRYCTPKAN